MDALEQYREAAILHGECSYGGQAKRANRAYDTLTRIRQEVRRAGPETARRLFLTLLDDSNVFVRLRAAVDALEFAPEDGLRVLREIAAGPISPWQGSAETLVEQWETGTFKAPW
jgi:HEAT repeat protein